MQVRFMITKISLAFVAASAISLVVAIGAGLAAGTWADDLWNAVNFYKANYPTSNFEPYLAQVAKVQEGVRRGEEDIVKAEMNQLLGMLRNRAFGINDVAADELYNLAMSARSSEPSSTATNIQLGIGSERPMSVPFSIEQTRDGGKEPCTGFADGGCDYWLDDMADYTGG